MKAVRLIASALFGLLVLATAVVALVLSVVDPDSYRESLGREATRMLGRTVTIQGAVEVRAFPYPALTISDAVVANAEWGQFPEILRIGVVSGELSLTAMLRGSIEVVRLVVDDAELFLEVSEGGQRNWSLPSPAEPGRFEPAALPDVRTVVVRNLAITHVDARGEQVLGAMVDNMWIHVDGVGGPVDVQARGSLRDEPWSIVAKGGPLRDLLMTTQSYELAVAAEFADMRASLRGAVRGPREHPRVDLVVDVDGRSTATLSTLTGMPIPPMGPFRLTAGVSGDPGDLSIAGMEGVIGDITLAGAGSLDWGEGRPVRLVLGPGKLSAVAGLDVPVVLDIGRAAIEVVGRRHELDFTGRLGAVPVSATATMVPIPGADERTDRFDIDGRVSALESTIAVSGRVEPREGHIVGDIGVVLSGPDIGRTAAAAGLPLPADGPFDLTIRLTGTTARHGDSSTFRVDGNVVGAEVAASGSLRGRGDRPGWPPRVDEVVTRIRISGDRADRLLRMLGIPGAPADPYRLDLRFERGDATFEVRLDTPTLGLTSTGVAAFDRGSAIDRGLRPRNLSVSFDLEATDPAPLASLMGFSWFPFDRFSMSGSIDDGTGRIRISSNRSDVRVALDVDAIWPSAIAIADPASIETVTATLSVEGENAAHLVGGRAADGKLGHYRLDVRLSGRPSDLAVDVLDAAAGQLELSARGRIRLADLGAVSGDGMPIDEIRLSNVVARVSPAEPPRSRQVVFDSVQIAANPAGAPVFVTAQGAVDGERIVLDAELASFRRFLENERDLPVSVKLDVGAAHLAIDGFVGSVAEGIGYRVQVDAQGSALDAVENLVDMGLPSGKPFRLAGSIVGRPGAVALERLDARLGESDLSGSATIDTVSRPPRFHGRLVSRRLVVDDLVSHDDGPEVERAGVPGEVPRLFDPNPLPIPFLRALNADFTAKVEELRFDKARLDDVEVAVKGGSGRVDTRISGSARGTRALEGRIEIDADGDGLKVDTLLTASDFDVGAFLAVAEVTDVVTGTVDVRAEIHSTGNSLHALAGRAHGRMSVVGEKGRIDSRLFDLIATDLARELLPWRRAKGDTEINCMVARFDVADGVATSKGMLLDTTRATMVGTGKIDLAAEVLELTVTPCPKEPALISLAFPIDIRGTLLAPTFSPNKAALAMDAAKLVIGTAINPLGLLIPFVNLGTGDRNPCVSALESKDGDPVPAPAGSDTPGGLDERRDDPGVKTGPSAPGGAKQ